ncbi:helix-turn-helix domain-containing protein [Marinospirillum alkaliphilum]|uniref:helix-turn-helix domain-containing protein n=1 Tax=Marinospirillum alkaliphilum TaxID=148454 RepID=UPI003CCB89A6
MEFASKFCISVATLRHWERGDRTLHGASLGFIACGCKRASGCFEGFELTRRRVIPEKQPRQ